MTQRRNWTNWKRGSAKLRLLLLARSLHSVSRHVGIDRLLSYCSRTNLHSPEIKLRRMTAQRVTKVGGHRRPQLAGKGEEGGWSGGGGGVCHGRSPFTARRRATSDTFSGECLRFLICLEHAGSQSWWRRSVRGHVTKRGGWGCRGGIEG